MSSSMRRKSGWGAMQMVRYVFKNGSKCCKEQQATGRGLNIEQRRKGPDDPIGHLVWKIRAALICHFRFHLDHARAGPPTVPKSSA
jgi:hypothetical protein